MTLSALPCDDELTFAEYDSIVMNSNSHDHHNSTDLCSPFCTCVCCANVVLEPIFDSEAIVVNVINTELSSSYIFSFSRDFYNQIFQPSRV